MPAGTANERHGGRSYCVSHDAGYVRPEPSLRRAGERAIRAVRPEPAYARLDCVRSAEGRWLVMELELIEPSLYLRMDDAAPARFARALVDHVGRQRAAT